MRRLAIAIALSLAAAAPAVAGPPWLTLEFRPFHDGGVVVVRTFHHGESQLIPLTGSAEGLVNGERRTVALTFDRADQPNAWSIPNTWGAGGVWVLNIAATGDHIGAGAVVGLDRNGEPTFARFPRTAVGASRAATPREVEALLRALDANAAPPAFGRTGWSVVVLRTALPFLVIVLVILGGVKLGAGIMTRVRARRHPSLEGATP